MKKRLFKIITVFMCAVLISACGNTVKSPGGKLNIRKVVNISLQPMSGPESMEMMNYMYSGRALISGDTLYTMEFDGELKPCLASYRINGGELSDFKILADSCTPEFLTEHEDRLYYINASQGRKIESVKTDGSGRELLNEGSNDFLRILDSSIYYTDSKQRLCKADIKGTGEQIVMPEACCYPYVIGDKLLYQKARNEHLYLYDFTDGSDMEITDVPSYGPVIIGDRLYCTLKDGVYSTDLEGMEPLKYELGGIQGEARYMPSENGIVISGICDAGGIYSWSFNTENVKESFKKTPGGVYRLCEFISEDYAVYTDFEPTGRIKGFVLSPAQGEEIKYMSGQSH